MSKKEYHREHMRTRYNKNRQRGLEILGGKCAICEGTDGLEFDHKDPTQKEVSSSRMFYLGDERFLRELNKCQLLCKEHHSFKSVLDAGKKHARGTHGTLSSYRYCKCELCRKAKRDYMQQYYSSRVDG